MLSLVALNGKHQSPLLENSLFFTLGFGIYSVILLFFLKGSFLLSLMNILELFCDSRAPRVAQEVNLGANEVVYSIAYSNLQNRNIQEDWHYSFSHSCMGNGSV